MEYNITAEDPQGDVLYYFIDWGDVSYSGWSGTFDSGDQISISHTWSIKITYMVRVKAHDSFGHDSNWATLTITMPYTYTNQDFWVLNCLF